jgi:hypothetical protein
MSLLTVFTFKLQAARPDKPGERKKNIFIRYLQMFGINYLTILVSVAVIELIGLSLLKLCGFI